MPPLVATPPSDVDSDSVAASSRSRSVSQQYPQQHQRQSPVLPDARRAHRACEKCTRTKKKCDKALPACSRCTRLSTNCCYDFVVGPPTLAVMEPAMLASYLRGSKGGNSFTGGFDWLSPVGDISASQIMELLTSRGMDWRAVAKTYFRTVNSWLSIVHRETWEMKVINTNMDSTPRSAELALVAVCMRLVTMWNSKEESATAMFEEPLYKTTKQIWAMKKAFSKPSVELIQCGMLISLYEYGHGDIVRAYQTLGEAASMAKAMSVRPGKYLEEEQDMPVDPEDEQIRALYWGLVIMDKLTHEECPTLWSSLQVDMPADDDLLPTEIYLWSKSTKSYMKTVKRYPSSITASVPLGAFQRAAQASILLGYAQQWEAFNAESGMEPSVLSFVELESATRCLVEAIITQSDNYSENLNAYAVCSSLLFLLFTSFLSSISPDSHNTNNLEVDKAIAGVNFTVRLVADGTLGLMNAFSSDCNEMLEKCAPPWPYAQYHAMKILWNYETMIEDATGRFAEMKKSMEFFAKRWGVARHLLDKFDRALHLSQGGIIRVFSRCSHGAGRTCIHTFNDFQSNPMHAFSY